MVLIAIYGKQEGKKCIYFLDFLTDTFQLQKKKKLLLRCKLGIGKLIGQCF